MKPTKKRCETPKEKGMISYVGVGREAFSTES